MLEFRPSSFQACACSLATIYIHQSSWLLGSVYVYRCIKTIFRFLQKESKLRSTLWNWIPAERTGHVYCLNKYTGVTSWNSKHSIFCIQHSVQKFKTTNTANYCIYTILIVTLAKYSWVAISVNLTTLIVHYGQISNSVVSTLISEIAKFPLKSIKRNKETECMFIYVISVYEWVFSQSCIAARSTYPKLHDWFFGQSYSMLTWVKSE